MSGSFLAGVAAELALFAAAGFLLFSLDDVLVDIIYFARRLWRPGRWRDTKALTLAERPGWMAAGVGCAIERGALGRHATLNDGQPFASGSMTEDYECGIRLGALGERTRCVRLPVVEGERALVASRGYFPATLGAAVRQKTRWIGGISFAGWQRLGWAGGWGERWFRMRDRKAPVAALLMVAGYGAALLWGQLWLAASLGSPPPPAPPPLLATLLAINAGLLVWRLGMRAGLTWAAYGPGEALASLPRVLASNLVAILATYRALGIHLRGAPKRWDKTHHTFPLEYSAS